MSSERFDKAASTWDEKPQRVQVAEKISEAITRLPLSPEMDGMEYGCGTGLVGLSLAPFLGHLTAMDTSSGMLEVLEKKIDEQGLKNVRPQLCDLLEDEYSGRHDLIICAMTLHHVEDAKKLLTRFTELLNMDGYLALADLVSEDGSFHDPAAEGIHHHGFDPQELSDHLSSCGMTDITVDVVHSIVKEEQGNRKFPVFLLTARKAS